MTRIRPIVSIGSRRLAIKMAICCAVIASSSADAADILVTSAADSGAGTLRSAIGQAASGDRIVFDIPGVPTIQLLSDLPTISGDIAFANQNAAVVTIDRNGNGPIVFQGGAVDPTSLNVVDTLGGVPPIDIQASADSTFYGASDLSGNILLPGTLSPGASPTTGTIGTFDLTGDLDATGADFQLDLQATGGAAQNDLVTVDGVLTVAGATLRPNFIGDQFQIGQNFLVIDSTNPLVGAFSNQGDSFQLPNNPFLEAVADASPADQFGLDIQDNGASFTSVVAGCNQLSAAAALDDLLGRPVPPTAVDSLRNGSSAEVAMAVNQLSGSIYPSLISAETNHLQNNLSSIRDRVAMRAYQTEHSAILVPWVRGYGVTGSADPDDCLTPGYRQEIGGAELGTVASRSDGICVFGFTHLANADVYTRGVDQHADIASYRFGGGVQYVGEVAYVFATGGGGVQDYDVLRSLDAFEGSTFAASSFDGSSQFGYVEVGTLCGSMTTILNPYLAVQSTRVELDPFSETGDPDFALSNPQSTGESLRGSLGIAMDQTGATPIGPARTRLRVGWLHEFLDEYQTVQSQLAYSSPPPVTLDSQGVAIGRDWGLVGLEVDWAIFGFGQLTAGYQGHFNSRSAFSSFLAGMLWVW